MTKQEFAKLAMAMRTYYSKEDKLLPNEQSMELWYRQLKDIPFDVASMALDKWVATNKWSPSIADLREQSSKIVNGDVPDWGAGWEQVLKAISRFGMYRADEAVESLTGVAKECVKRLGFRNICLSENVDRERANFRMLYEELSDRKQKHDQMPDDLIRMIAEHQKALNGDSELLKIGEFGE